MIWSALLKEYRAKVICLLLALVTVVVIFGLKSWVSYKGQTEWYRQEVQRLQDEKEQEEREKEELRNKLYSFCNTQREPQVCKEIAKAGVEVQVSAGFKGLAKFAVSLGRSEQNYQCPVLSHNCFGLGAYDRFHYNRYGSYEEAVLDLARLLRRFGYTTVSPKDFDRLSLWYKGKAPYAPWVAMLKSFWKEIG